MMSTFLILVGLLVLLLAAAILLWTQPALPSECPASNLLQLYIDGQEQRCQQPATKWNSRSPKEYSLLNSPSLKARCQDAEALRARAQLRLCSAA